jgi:hypothetical protein
MVRHKLTIPSGMQHPNMTPNSEGFLWTSPNWMAVAVYRMGSF